MRSLPAFLMAFIVTVIISGALMMGCGGAGDSSDPIYSNNTGSSNNNIEAYNCTWYSVNSNTDCASLISYNSCGEGFYNSLLICTGRTCQKNCVRTVGYANNNNVNPPASNNNTAPPANNNTSAVGQVCCTGDQCKNTHIDCPAGYNCDMYIQIDSSGNGRCYKPL